MKKILVGSVYTLAFMFTPDIGLALRVFLFVRSTVEIGGSVAIGGVTVVGGTNDVAPFPQVSFFIFARVTAPT